jgi:UDP-N-acetylglucosamine transferase subunit ALG13
LKELDILVEQKKILDDIFAQTGYSDYSPKNYKYKKFLNRDEFKEIMGKSDKVITHGGTGAIVGAVKQGKKVIAVPRLKEYGEHVDDHQLQIVNQFKEMGFIDYVKDITEIGTTIRNVENIIFKEYTSNTKKITEEIIKFINM